MIELAPEHSYINLNNATDAEIEAAIDEANKRGYSVNTNVPATEEGIGWFLSNFTCRRCGKCCVGSFEFARENGIFISDREIVQISSFLRVRPRKIKKLCRADREGRLSLPYPCPFYMGTPKPKCSIYSVRPLICQYYPLYSGKSVLSVDAECPAGKEIALMVLKGAKKAVKSR